MYEEQMMKNLTNIFALIALAASASAMAATDGSLDGTQSQGSTDVTLDVTEVVQVSFPNGDIPIAYSTTTTTPVTEEFCIYTNAADGGVGVAISVLNDNSAGTNQPAVLKNGANEIEYSFDFETQGGGSTIAASIDEDGMSEVATSTADTASPTCASGNSHQLVVTVPAANMAAAPVGTYSDTITVTVQPAL
jgi:hypothetical protein